MNNSSGILLGILIVAVLLLVDSAQAKRDYGEDTLYRVAAARSRTRKGGCASFGHSCFGGHGKRSQSPDGTNNDTPWDAVDLQTLKLFRKLCTLRLNRFLRLTIPSERLVGSNLGETEETLIRD